MVANCHFTGTVRGCGPSPGFAVPSCVVTITDTTDTTAYSIGTITTNSSGVFSGTAAIPGNGTSVHVHLTPGDPFASRFAAFTPILKTFNTDSLTNPNLVGTLNLSGTAPYYCSAYVYYPLNATLTLVDAVIGTTTIFNDGTGNGWIGTQSYNFPLCTQTPPVGGCPAFSGLTVTYKIASAITATIQYGCRFVSACPNNAGGAITFGSYTPDTIVINPFSATTASNKIDQIGLYCYCNGGANCLKLTIHE